MKNYYTCVPIYWFNNLFLNQILTETTNKINQILNYSKFLKIKINNYYVIK